MSERSSMCRSVKLAGRRAQPAIASADAVTRAAIRNTRITSYAIRTVMFSASLEVVLTIAYREAVSRRHAYLTLEHLLYALAHDPEGERILQGCGADLPRLRKELNQYLDESVEQLKRGHEREPEQTAAFQRVLQTAVLHVQSAQRAEVHAGDVLAAIMQQPKSHAARLLQSHNISRLDVLDFISHGISKVPQSNGAAAPGDGGDATA